MVSIFLHNVKTTLGFQAVSAKHTFSFGKKHRQSPLTKLKSFCEKKIAKFGVIVFAAVMTEYDTDEIQNI